MRYSWQRNVIYEYVMNSFNHPTANDIYSDLKKEYPTLSLGTIYRNLNTLVENKMIKKIDVSNSFDRFDKTLKDHSHVLCINCNKMIDVCQSTNNLKEDISNKYNFKVISYNSLFKGICKKCQKKEEENK